MTMPKPHHLGLHRVAIGLLQQTQGAHGQGDAGCFHQHARYLHQTALGGHRIDVGGQLLAVAQKGRKLVVQAHGQKRLGRYRSGDSAWG